MDIVRAENGDDDDEHSNSGGVLAICQGCIPISIQKSWFPPLWHFEVCKAISKCFHLIFMMTRGGAGAIRISFLRRRKLRQTEVKPFAQGSAGSEPLS